MKSEFSVEERVAEIAGEIYERREKILENINQESVNVYLWLKDEYKKDNIKNNLVFQFVFRSFYGLDRAGLSYEQKARFFELMAEKDQCLRTILEGLWKLPTLKKKKTIQFSFATKLLHTIDNKRPVFDTEVSTVIHKVVAGNNKDDKTRSAERIYDYLIHLYTQLIKDKQVQKVINEFKTNFSIKGQNMTDEKILDFLIWSLGKFKKK